jgi:hypothetical protein
MNLSLSLHWLFFNLGFGALVAICIGLLYCAITGFEDPSTVNPKLLAPFIRGLYKPKYVEVELEHKDAEHPNKV